MSVSRLRTDAHADFNGILGGVVRAARKQAGLNQSQLGAVLGCSGPLVCLMERGNSPITTYTLVRIAAALDVPPAALLRRALFLVDHQSARAVVSDLAGCIRVDGPGL